MCKGLFRTFRSGKGDCIFLLLEDEGQPYNIMVDCGNFTDEIEEFVNNKLLKHIHLLVITHIDCDHVDGICEMLRKHSDLVIDKILYNCYQMMDGAGIAKNPVVVADTNKLKRNLSPLVPLTEGKIGIEQACDVAGLILSNPRWCAAWQKDSYFHKDINPINLGGKFGRIILLSPTQEDLKALEDIFAREYLRLTHHPAVQVPYNGSETLFELVIRIVQMKRQEKAFKKNIKVGYKREQINEETIRSAAEFDPQRVSDENSASIAFIWECNGKRLLFLGDAEPSVVNASIKEKYQVPLDIVAVKVSHHGSKHSTNMDLLKNVKTSEFFVTGGNKTDKPSIEALAKIFTWEENAEKVIHYNNRESALMKALSSNDCRGIRDTYHIQVTDANELEFEY